MKPFEEYLLEELTKAAEKRDECSIQLNIAQKEYEAIRAAYQAFMRSKEA